MTLFDLVFIFLFLASVATLITAALVALRGRRAHALGIVGKLAVAAIGYLLIVSVVGLLAPQRVLGVGDPWCFDDWCLSVESVTRIPAPPSVRVSLRILSRSRRVTQRAKDAWIYVIDRNGNRYAPDPDASAAPLDVRLAAGESVTMSRTFRVPADAGELGLITGHGAWGPGHFIIGDEASFFHKRTFVRLSRDVCAAQ